MPGDVTGVLTGPFPIDPKREVLWSFLFHRWEHWGSEGKWFVQDQAANEQIGIGAQVYVAPNTDGLASMTKWAHLWSSHGKFWRYLENPYFISFVTTTLESRHQCLYYQGVKWDSLLSIPAWKWESGPEFIISESDLLVSWAGGPSRGMEGKTRSRGRGIRKNKALGDPHVIQRQFSNV